MFETLLLTMDARGVARLRLNREAQENRLSGRTIEELTVAAHRLGADAQVRVVVLESAGASFCAGGDLDWMMAQVNGTADSRRAAATGLAMMLHSLNAMPKPLIGRVQGVAFGGGLGLISVCDLAVGVEDALFGLTETKLGLIPATISPYVVGRIGVPAARRHMLASKPFGAAEAERIGLLAHVVSASGLEDAIEAEVAPFLGCAPEAVGEAKALIRRLTPPIDEALIEDTIDRLVRRWESAESAEGIAALLEKRPPSWAR